jgi:hypothetical protein
MMMMMMIPKMLEVLHTITLFISTESSNVSKEIMLQFQNDQERLVADVSNILSKP